MEVEEFLSTVGEGDYWGNVLTTRFPDVLASATAAYMERLQSEDRHNGAACALVLTPGFLWRFDLMSARKQPALKVCIHAEPLGTLTMNQEIEADEIGSGGEITSFKITLTSRSGWCVELPLGDKDLGPRQRKRSLEFVQEILDSQGGMSKR